jgi:hypothetical protein
MQGFFFSEVPHLRITSEANNPPSATREDFSSILMGSFSFFYQSDNDPAFDPGNVSDYLKDSRNIQPDMLLFVLGFNLAMKHGFLFKFWIKLLSNRLLDRENF